MCFYLFNMLCFKCFCSVFVLYVVMNLKKGGRVYKKHGVSMDINTCVRVEVDGALAKRAKALKAKKVALMRSVIRFTQSAQVLPSGVGVSLETTTWSDVEGLCRDKQGSLDKLCQEVALKYVERVRTISFGLFGHQGRDDQEEALAIMIRPLGIVLIQFGGPYREACGCYYLTIESGLLASTHAQGTKGAGRLYFRWWCTGQEEVFETELVGFQAMLLGRSANAIQRVFYRLTQMNMHRFVMWRFHDWVRAHREACVHV